MIFSGKTAKKTRVKVSEEFLHINTVHMNVVCVKGHPGTSENVFPLTMIPYTQITFNSLTKNVPSFVKFRRRANVLPGYHQAATQFGRNWHLQ